MSYKLEHGMEFVCQLFWGEFELNTLTPLHHDWIGNQLMKSATIFNSSDAGFAEVAVL